jgi:hypothetical protein
MSEDKIQAGTRIDDPNAVRDVIPDSGLRPVLARVLGKGRKWFGGDRFGGVCTAVQTAVQYLQPRLGKPASLLDFGCGNMAISSLLLENGVVGSVRGVDTYAPSVAGDEKFGRYTQISDAAKLPFGALDFDVAICVDVLHHIGISQAPGVLRELGRVSRFVVTKDHFEYGFISRQLLRLADWYGNYAYGVNVPDRYFDPAAWQEIVAAAGMDEIRLTCPVRIHDGFFGWIILPKNHFVSILTAR